MNAWEIALVVLLVLLAIPVVVSIPEIKRYLRIRRM